MGFRKSDLSKQEIRDKEAKENTEKKAADMTEAEKRATSPPVAEATKSSEGPSSSGQLVVKDRDGNDSFVDNDQQQLQHQQATKKATESSETEVVKEEKEEVEEKPEKT